MAGRSGRTATARRFRRIPEMCRRAPHERGSIPRSRRMATSGFASVNPRQTGRNRSKRCARSEACIFPVDTELAIAAAFVCALDPNPAEHFIVAPEVLKWTRQAATVSAEANIDTPSRPNFSVSLSLPGRLLCRLRREGLPALHYQLLLQPSSEARCVVHLSSNGPPLDLNRALVRFRRYVEAANHLQSLRAIYETFVQASPIQISNDENGAGR